MPKYQSELTPEDFFRTITGFEEIAIGKVFREDLSTMREKPFRFIRALVFLDCRRNGDTDADAYRGCMEMPMGELENYFAEDEQEIDPDSPESDQGKGVSS